MISSKIWTSEKFLSLENLRDRMAYIWLHCSQKTSAGVLRLGPAHMADELDFVGDIANAEEVFEALERAGLIVRQKPFVTIVNFLRFNPVKTYRHAISAWKEVLLLPDSEIKRQTYAELRGAKGTLDLIAWRNKDGQPHEVIFEMERLASQIEGWESEAMPSEPDIHSDATANPSDTPNGPISIPSDTHANGVETPSGKPIIKKEKREIRPEAATGSAPTASTSAPSATDERHRRGARPTASALNSALAMGCGSPMDRR